MSAFDIYYKWTNVIARKLQHGGGAEISARAESRYVIGP